LIDVKIDEVEVEKIFLEEVKKRLDQLQNRQTFWDMKELLRQTNMSEPFIKEKFFFDPRFPKYKVGAKWLFPAKECEDFLLTWLREQMKY
jgi:phage pi2 protein 07